MGLECRTAVKLISVNTAEPSHLKWRGRTLSSAIRKQSRVGRVALRKHNLDGDRQADLSVHGGPHKAVYCYAVEHYPFWKIEMPRPEWPHGIFGENFTTEGLLESGVHLGDRFAVGSAEVVVTQPRLPCHKLAARFESDDMVKRFLASGRTGFYLGVVREGEVGSGDEIRTLALDPNGVSVSQVTRLYVSKTLGEDDTRVLRRALLVEALPEAWKEELRERLGR